MITFYLSGLVVSYLMTMSSLHNATKYNLTENPSKLLIVLTAITFVISSWSAVLLFIILGFIDDQYRRIFLYPFNFKLYFKL